MTYIHIHTIVNIAYFALLQYLMYVSHNTTINKRKPIKIPAKIPGHRSRLLYQSESPFHTYCLYPGKAS